MITGTTSSGFEFRVPDGIKKDYRFLRAYKKLRSGRTEQQLDGALEMVACVFGDEAEEDRFLQFLADEHGRADVETVFRELGEIIAKASEEDDDVKKS
ncbi:MAG: hypothetical protein IIZ83_06855 [Oscillospiraceae bacterium]|nr:hypothetical protein [Oscillospiraceae bacterium]